MLKNLTSEANRTSFSFTYAGNTGLLKSKSENSDKTVFFNYQKNGKIEQIIEAVAEPIAEPIAGPAAKPKSTSK